MCATATTEVTPLPLWLSVPQFAKAVGISDTLAGQLAETGLVRAHKHGRRKVIRIHRDEVARYLDATLIHPEPEGAPCDADTAAPPRSNLRERVA